MDEREKMQAHHWWFVGFVSAIVLIALLHAVLRLAPVRRGVVFSGSDDVTAKVVKLHQRAHHGFSGVATVPHQQYGGIQFPSLRKYREERVR